MKSWLRIGLSVIAVSMFAVFFSVGEASAQINKIGEIKRRMDTHNKGLNTLRAKVTMVKTNAQLGGDSDTTVGTAIYAKRPGKDALVRIDWQRPEESLAVADGKYIMFRPRLNIAYTGSVKKATSDTRGNSALAFMNMSKAELDANYDVTLLAENITLSSGVRTWHLKLVPKSTTSYQSAEIWVDPDGMPQQTKIIEKNNDTTTVLLTNLEKNAKLDKSNFVISLPKGTKVQQS